MTAEEIFLAALERPEAERGAFLEEVAAGDAALRAEVETLLRSHAQAGTFLDGGLFRTPEPAPAAPLEAPGTCIGPYRLLQQIGEGGMGTVFLAEQTRPVRRRVALKVMKPGVTSAASLARFEAERQALALMDHPNIARVLDAGTVESAGAVARPYFVMELIHGVPITTWCDEHRLSPRERLALFLPVCLAVQHAHQKGVIHRDLKPSNILVCTYDGRPTPKVIDFGVAKAVGAPLTDRTLFTAFGQVVGTPQYMSPEQADLDAVDVDTRSDVYSLGVVLYELLTGTTPLEAHRVREGALLDTLRLVREDDPPTPSARLSTTAESPAIGRARGLSPQRLRRAVRGDLDWIVMRCLEKDRSRRYESAGGLADDLQRYLADQPVTAGPPSAAYRLRKLVRRHPTRVAVLLLGSLLALGGAVVAFWWQGEAARRTSEESQRVARLERDGAAALAEAEALLGSPGAFVEDLPAWQAALTGAGSALERARSLLREAGSGADPRLSARLAEVQARVEADRRDRDLVATYEAWRLEKTRVNLVANRFDDRRDHGALVASLRGQGIEFGTTPIPEVVAAVRRRPRAIQDRLVAAIEDYFYARDRVERTPHAPWFHRLVQVLEDDPWRHQVRVAVSAADAAGIRQAAGEVRADEQPLAFLIRMARAMPRDLEDVRLALLRAAQAAHPDDFWANHELGMALRTAGDDVGAARFHTAALARRPQNVGVLLNLAVALEGSGDLDGALGAIARALALEPGYAMAHVIRAEILDRRGDLDGALRACREAAGLAPRDVVVQACFARRLEKEGLREECLAAARAALEGDEPRERSYVTLAEMFLRLGDRDLAVAAYRKAVEFDPRDADAWNDLGIALSDGGDHLAAVEAYRRALSIRNEAGFHANLGISLSSLEDWPAALAALQEAARLAPGEARVHFLLGSAQDDTYAREDAAASFRRALGCDPRHLRARRALGTTLIRLGRFEEARTVLEQGREFHGDGDPGHADLESAIEQAVYFVGLAEKLPEVLSGEQMAADAWEVLDLATVAAAQRRYPIAARLSETAFEREPRWLEDLDSARRLAASFYAAMAGTGEGKEPIQDEAERARWRAQSLAWLRADWNLWRRRVAEGKPEDRARARFHLWMWQNVPELAGVRESDRLAALPAEERREWKRFWADVAALRERTLPR